MRICMLNNTTFRVFISSTFNDLKDERNVLQNEVFPYIKEYCEQKGYRFQVIDLRWGVSDEAGLNHKAMKICIDEVKRSINHPKPNFIVLMGDRYGWIPLATEIEKNSLDEIITQTDKDDENLLRQWYILDTNALHPQYILQPINKILHQLQGSKLNASWQQIESKLLSIIQNAIQKLPAIRQKEFSLFFTSATEQEIQNGVFNINEKNRVFILERTISNFDEFSDNKHLHVYQDYTANNTLDTQAQQRLTSLKKQLKEESLSSFLSFKTHFYKDEHNQLSLDKHFLNNYVYETKTFLQKHIDGEIRRIEALDDTKVEQHYHQKFLHERASSFIGREDIIEDIQSYLKSDNNSFYVLYGNSGVGKSALMAKIISLQPSESVIYRFIGITEKSSSPIIFLNDLLHCLEEKLGFKKERDIINEYDTLVTKVIEQLHRISETTKLTLIIDALDQFKEPTKLEWISELLPKNIKIILSTLEGEYLELLKNKLPKESFHELLPFEAEDTKNILLYWFKQNNRTLTSIP